MKLMLSVILGLLWTSTSQAVVPASLSVTSLRGFTDRDAELFLILSRATNTTALQFDLTFDPAHANRMTPVWSPLLSNHVVRTRELQPGVWRTLIYSQSNALLKPNLALASLPFHIPAAERNGSGPIAPSRFVLSHPDATAVEPVATRPGRIFVTQVSPPDPDGSVSLFFPVTKQTDYVLFASDDFRAWTAISTNAASGNIVDFIDADAVRYPHRFYFMNEAVTAGTPGLSAFVQLSTVGVDGDLRIPAPAAGRYVVESSSDLKSWTVVGDTTNSTGMIEVKVPNLKSSDQRFYRLRPR